jgi:glycosyltransferase involved in cell wall biosynthesis
MSARVCAVAYTDYCSDPRVRREAEALVSRGDRVTVLALKAPDDPLEETVDGVRLVHLPVARYRGNEVRPYLQSYGRFMVLAGRYLARRARSIDVVHAHSMPEAVVFAALVPRLIGRPVVLDVHDLSTEAYASRLGRPPAAVRAAERASLRFASAVLTVHERYAGMIRQRGVPSPKVSVVLNTPDDRMFPMSEPHRPDATSPRLVYHGSLLRRYGVDVAMRAFRTLAGELPAARFDIYGDGDHRADLEDLACTLGLDQRVTFHGRVPVDELAPALAGADVGLVPFRRDPFTANILPTKLLEYVRLGIPAVASDNDVVRRYLGDGAVTLVEPDSVDALTDGVRQVLADPAGARARAGRAQGFFERHGWPHYREELFRVMDRCMGVAS